jgi:tripartite-type tricarboxylate transporter receptor subunit TctC
MKLPRNDFSILHSGVAAGGTSDIVARVIAQSLPERLGQSFAVANRAGAATNREAAARANPDGSA